MTSSIIKKGKWANADAVKVAPFSLAWSVFCVKSFLSFSRAVNRQLKTYVGFWFCECERRQRRKDGTEARCCCEAHFAPCYATGIAARMGAVPAGGVVGAVVGVGAVAGS
jgi:hypothetical protein